MFRRERIEVLIPFPINLAYLNIPGLFDEFANNIDRALPILLYYDHHNLSTQQSITKRIKEFYFNDDVTQDKERNVTNVCIDTYNVTFTLSLNLFKSANDSKLDVSLIFRRCLVMVGSYQPWIRTCSFGLPTETLHQLMYTF